MLFKTRLDRRITLLKPPTGRDSEYNETQSGWVTVFRNVPAGKVEQGSGSKEGLELTSAVRSEVEIQWEIRFIGMNNIPKSNWRIIDEYEFEYDVIAAPIEIGRRAGWLIKTKQVQ